MIGKVVVTLKIHLTQMRLLPMQIEKVEAERKGRVNLNNLTNLKKQKLHGLLKMASLVVTTTL